MSSTQGYLLVAAAGLQYEEHATPLQGKSAFPFSHPLLRDN